MDKSVETAEKNVPRIYFEILVYVENENKEKIKNTLETLQEQINKSRASKNKVRILWYVDSGEKTNEQKIEWLIENAKCKYYLILSPQGSVPKNYVKDALSKIKTFEKSLNSLKTANVCFAQKSNNKTKTLKKV